MASEEELRGGEEVEEEITVAKSNDQNRQRIREQKSQQRQKMSIKQLEAWFGAKEASASATNG